MQRLNLAGTLMLGKKKCFHFVIINDFCAEFTPIARDTSIYPFGCDPKEFKNYKENLVTFFYDRTTPPTQQYLDFYLKELGMKYYEMGTLIRKQNGRAMSDPFWLVPDNE